MNKITFNYHALFEKVNINKAEFENLAKKVNIVLNGPLTVSLNEKRFSATIAAKTILSIKYDPLYKLLFLEILDANERLCKEISKIISNKIGRTPSKEFKIPKTKEEFILLEPSKWFFDVYEIDEKGTTLAIKGKKIFSKRSPFQLIEVYETIGFGKMLTLDKMVMLTEADEFSYHEMLVHPAMHIHPKAEKILVIGGGDGCAVRELLKHEVKEIHLCEIDKDVIETCLKFFPGNASKLKDERVKIFYEDGFSFLKGKENEYDIIFVDSTDPIGPGITLFSEEFYERCFKALKDDGILVTQCESLFYHTEFIAKNLQKLRKFFARVWYYYTLIPTYPSGCYGFCFSSKNYHPLKDIKNKEIKELKYYNLQNHKAAFMLPNFALKRFYEGCEEQKKELVL